MKSKVYYASVLLALCPFQSDAFALQRKSSVTREVSTEESKTSPTASRRNFVQTIVSNAVVAQLVVPAAYAATKSTEAEDKAKILDGYKRLGYLLDNWEKLTTNCDGTKKDPFTNKIVCERTPLVVQEYLGYRSINDPLFKADKTLLRLEAYVPASRETDFLDCLEKWQATADEASGMAYTSSWAGPQNPNGNATRLFLRSWFYFLFSLTVLPSIYLR